MSILTADVSVWLDTYLIALYRVTGYAFIDYFVGTFLLGFAAVVLGELTLSLALRINRRYIEGMEKELTGQHELSLAALSEKDKRAYKACNDQANDAFGRYFFTMIAHSAAYLWPIPFALTWMQSRFWSVEFELAYPVSLVWSSTGYFTTFFLNYVLARIVFKNMRPYLPYFKGVHRSLHTRTNDEEVAPAPEPSGDRHVTTDMQTI